MANAVPVDELELWRSDPLREKRLAVKYVFCRECGVRMERLYHHLRKIDQIAPDDYERKWRFPPLVAEGYRETARKTRLAWGKSQGIQPGDGSEKRASIYFVNRNPFDPSKGPTARRGKPASAATRRHLLSLRERTAGKPRPDRLGKGPGFRNYGLVLNEQELSRRLISGESKTKIAHDSGLTVGAVSARSLLLGFQRGGPRAFLHGKEVAVRDLDDLCSDFGISRRLAISTMGSSYWAVMNWTSRLRRSGGPQLVSKSMDDKLLALRRRWTEAFCFRGEGKSRVREFTASEVRDIRELYRQVVAVFQSARDDRDSIAAVGMLAWLNLRAREETATRRAPGSFVRIRNMEECVVKVSRLWLSRTSVGVLATKFLAVEFDCPDDRIRRVVNGELPALDPRSLSGGVTRNEHIPMIAGNAVASKSQATREAGRGKRRGISRQDRAAIPLARLTPNQEKCYRLSRSGQSFRQGARRLRMAVHFCTACKGG